MKNKRPYEPGGTEWNASQKFDRLLWLTKVQQQLDRGELTQRAAARLYQIADGILHDDFRDRSFDERFHDPRHYSLRWLVRRIQRLWEAVTSEPRAELMEEAQQVANLLRETLSR